MSATNQYLDALARKYPNEKGQPASDYRLAQLLGLDRQAVSGYRRDKNTPGNKVCLRLAELLEVNPLEVIAAVERDRSKTDSDRDFWGGQLRRMGVAAGVGLCIMHTAFFSGDAHASTLSSRSAQITEIYLMRLRAWLARLAGNLISPIGLFELSPA